MHEALEIPAAGSQTLVHDRREDPVAGEHRWVQLGEPVADATKGEAEGGGKLGEPRGGHIALCVWKDGGPCGVLVGERERNSCGQHPNSKR